MTSSISSFELEELQAEFDSLEADFAEFDLAEMDDDHETLSELDAELSGTGLGELSVGGDDYSEMFADEFEQQFIGRLLKGKARKIIARIVALVKRAKGCAHCVPKVVSAVRLFKAKRYGAAIRAAWVAYRCIRKCLK